MVEVGFRHFVGVDGSKGMLQQAAKTGLYQDLRLAVLGLEPLPAQSGQIHSHLTHCDPLTTHDYTSFIQVHLRFSKIFLLKLALDITGLNPVPSYFWAQMANS